MKILVVGGSGLIGGEIALLLQQAGHDVTIMARKPPVAPALARLALLTGDYIRDDMTDGRLEGFDWLVFSAAADIRNLPQDGSVAPEDFYTRVNDEAVPAFFAAARDAGIRRAVYIGTFYPQVAPQRVGVCPYVTSRHNTDLAVRALSGENFGVCSLNPPFVLGRIPGLDIPHLEALAQYARGNIPDMPVFAPPGGTNHMTSGSIAQATHHALQGGEAGKAYLLGDENYSWKDYLEAWFAAAGNPVELEVRDEDHPLFPNVIMFAGAGATVSYEPDVKDMGVLRYDRGQVAPLIRELAAQ